MQRRTPLLIAAICLTACATPSTVTRDFPAGATPPSAAELQQRLSDKKFSIRYASGGSARVQFMSGGQFSFDASNNTSNAGTWTTQDGKLCMKAATAAENCFPARVGEGKLYIQRANGEIIQYEPQ